MPLADQVRMASSASKVVPMDPVKLIASDGSEIILDRRAAMVSGTIKSMLSGPGARLHATALASSLWAPALHPPFFPAAAHAAGHSPPPMPAARVDTRPSALLHRQLHRAATWRGHLSGHLSQGSREDCPVLLLQAAIHQSQWAAPGVQD
eukprot:scaffold243557_cov31-Tisochrysis_lutea.AAC.2